MYTGAPTPADHKRSGSSGAQSPWNGQAAGSREGPLEWWYNLAAPIEPQNSTPQDREQARAGRLSSIILLITFCFGLSQLPNALVSRNHFFLYILLIAMVINVAAFVLNRQGKVRTVGIMMVIVVEAAFIMIVLTSSSGVSLGTLPTFELMIVTELMAVSLLPPKSVFLATSCNCLFTWAAISFMPHAANFKITTASSYYSALASPIGLQIIVAIVTYLWVEGARQAIERAEQVAELERAIAERDRAAAEQKQKLEYGIQQILQTHIQAANGNFDTRAPLAQDNVLWQVAHGLNNLLVRLQRATQSENEFQRTRTELVRLMEAVRNAKMRRRPIQQVPRSGTILDPLAQELTGNYISPPHE